MSEKKLCIACFEPIDARARKCSHCFQIQSKVANSSNHPASQYVMVIVVVLLLLYAGQSIYKLTHPGKLGNQLSAGASTLRIEDRNDNVLVSCFASIKNQSNVVWSNPSLQATFRDSTGATVDVHYQRHSVSVYPSFSMLGRVSGTANAAKNRYQSCTMTILDAD